MTSLRRFSTVSDGYRAFCEIIHWGSGSALIILSGILQKAGPVIFLSPWNSFKSLSYTCACLCIGLALYSRQVSGDEQSIINAGKLIFISTVSLSVVYYLNWHFLLPLTRMYRIHPIISITILEATFRTAGLVFSLLIHRNRTGNTSGKGLFAIVVIYFSLFIFFNSLKGSDAPMELILVYAWATIETAFLLILSCEKSGFTCIKVAGYFVFFSSVQIQLDGLEKMGDTTDLLFIAVLFRGLVEVCRPKSRKNTEQLLTKSLICI